MNLLTPFSFRLPPREFDRYNSLAYRLWFAAETRRVTRNCYGAAALVAGMFAGLFFMIAAQKAGAA